MPERSDLEFCDLTPKHRRFMKKKLIVIDGSEAFVYTIPREYHKIDIELFLKHKKYRIDSIKYHVVDVVVLK